nr:fatty acid amide hydrolase-like [Ipomoea batatas]
MMLLSSKALCTRIEPGLEQEVVLHRDSYLQALPCIPTLSSNESLDVLGSLRLGKYTEWFNDVFSTEISDKCDDVLNQLSKQYGCKTIEIAIPELHEIVSIGSESLCSLNPDVEDGYAHSTCYFYLFIYLPLVD